jgi:protein-tyrosine phosphatase
MRRSAFQLAIVGLAACIFGVRAGLWGLPLVWFGANFLVLTLAYLKRAHHIFGKRPDGTLPLWSWIFFLPYFAYTNLIWRLMQSVSREPACNEVSGQLLIGRRLLGSELPEGISNYVDLTAEFQEPRRARKLPGYLSFPVLDAGAPEPQALKRVIESLKPGRTLVHCAQGHGRTGLFALATLFAERAVSSVDEGLHRLQSVRPRIRLNREQRGCIDEFARLVSRTGGES